MDQMLLFDTTLPQVTAGTDEAGRGPLAGPVYAACVILPENFPTEILNDSKKLSQKRRLEAELLIKRDAIWGVAFATHKEIDAINILQASMLATRRAYEKADAMFFAKTGKHIELLLADGNRRPPVDIPCQAIVKGDASVPQIMAASILAKCERDRFMKKAALKWPVYGFEKHMGYPTKAHRDAIKQFGPCPIHRLTFTVK